MENPNVNVKVTRMAYVMGIDALQVIPSFDGRVLRLYLHKHLLLQIELPPKQKHRTIHY